jgi:hypothetical protein
MEYSKVGDKLQESETITTKRSYSYQELLGRKQMYEQQVVQAQKMLDKINITIAEAEKLGIK